MPGPQPGDTFTVPMGELRERRPGELRERRHAGPPRERDAGIFQQLLRHWVSRVFRDHRGLVAGEVQGEAGPNQVAVE